MTTYIPNAGPNLSSKRGWLRRRWGWWAGAVAVCVLAAGAYIFFAKPGQAQSRTAKPGQAQSTGKPGQNAGARSVPVVPTKTCRAFKRYGASFAVRRSTRRRAP